MLHFRDSGFTGDSLVNWFSFTARNRSQASRRVIFSFLVIASLGVYVLTPSKLFVRHIRRSGISTYPHSQLRKMITPCL